MTLIIASVERMEEVLGIKIAEEHRRLMNQRTHDDVFDIQIKKTLIIKDGDTLVNSYKTEKNERFARAYGYTGPWPPKQLPVFPDQPIVVQETPRHAPDPSEAVPHVVTDPDGEAG